MNNIWTIYGYRSPENKWYIGQTTKSLIARAGGKNGYFYTRKDTSFCMAIRQYGFVNMEPYVLKTCTSQEEANYWEQFFIEEKNSLFPNGYNLQSGGVEGSFFCSNLRDKISTSMTSEVRQKLSDSLKGTCRSEETKQKIAERTREAMNKPEVRRKCAEDKKGRKWFNNGIRNVFVHECPDGFTPGMLKRA